MNYLGQFNFKDLTRKQYLKPNKNPVSNNNADRLLRYNHPIFNLNTRYNQPHFNMFNFVTKSKSKGCSSCGSR